MRNKKIMIDFDCTLVDFLTPYLKWCQNYLDIDIRKFDMSNYDWPHKFIGSGCSAFWKSDLYFDGIKPFTDAKEFIHQLWENDINFAICSIVEEKYYMRKHKMIDDLFGFYGLEIILLPITTQKRHSLECDDSYVFIDDRKSYIDPGLDILYNHNNMHPWADNHPGEHYRVMNNYDQVLDHILGRVSRIRS